MKVETLVCPELMRQMKSTESWCLYKEPVRVELVQPKAVHENEYA